MRMIRKDQLNQEKVRIVNKEKIARERGRLTRPSNFEPKENEEMMHPIRNPADKKHKH